MSVSISPSGAKTKEAIAMSGAEADPGEAAVRLRDLRNINHSY